MSTPDHSSRQHALLAASSAQRWLTCTPSAVLEAQEPDEASAYAQEGTLAHELCELYLNGREDEADSRFTAEMHEHARAYTDYIVEKSPEGSTRVIEERVDFSAYVPEGFGTCDCLILSDKKLTIVDFKYGVGIKVDAEDNPQLKLYALGALDTYSIAYDFDEVELCIFQPRIDHISEWTVSVNDLNRWAEEILKPKAALAIEGKGERKAGDHCKFCRYAPKCGTLADRCLEDFDTEVEDLTPERIADILAREKTINSWLKNVKDYAMTQMFERPDAIPGFKLVEGMSKRRYADVDKIGELLIKEGYKHDDIFKAPELLGITDMTKLLGKKRFSELLGDLIEKPKGAPTIAPISDKRQALDASAMALKDFDVQGD